MEQPEEIRRIIAASWGQKCCEAPASLLLFSPIIHLSFASIPKGERFYQQFPPPEHHKFSSTLMLYILYDLVLNSVRAIIRQFRCYLS